MASARGTERGVAAARRPVEALGTVSCPSGDLVVLDFGLLRLWSGDDPPHVEEGVMPADIAARANASADFEIVGPDAQAVAAQLDLAAVKGRFAFDLAADGELIRERVAAVCSSTGLDARVESIDRMPHGQRLRRLLDEHPEGAEVPFHGVWGVAVRGVPRAQRMKVFGTRMDPQGPDAGRWHSVWVECDEREPVSSREVGYVLVDEARLMFADPSALNAWTTDETLDGLADLAFWGRDAAGVAQQVGADVLHRNGEHQTFGWADLPVEEVVELGEQLVALQQDPSRKFVMDFRPHDDHHRLLTLAWASPTESGSISVGGVDVTGFFTSWGDGAFPVFRDVAEDGSLCRVRVELGAPETVRRARRLDELWFGELSKTAFVSASVAREHRPVGWLYREAPDRDVDSGWRMFAGDETQEYLDDPSNAILVPLRELIAADPELEELLSTPAPAAYERTSEGRFVPADPPPAS